MTLKVTERDKKLLVFLAAFVLIFGIGLLVIDPLATSNSDLQFELETAMMEKQQNVQKINMTGALTERREEEQEQLEQEQQAFFAEMPVSGIDQLVTEMALKNGAEINELDISMPAKGEYAELGAYLSAAEDSAVYPGVYGAEVRMVLTGSRPALQAMLDECAAEEPRIRLERFAWQTSGGAAGDGSQTERLSLTFDVYMYQNVQEYLATQQAVQESAAPEDADASSEDAGTMLDVQ